MPSRWQPRPFRRTGLLPPIVGIVWLLLAVASGTQALQAPTEARSHRYAILMLGAKIGTQTVEESPILYRNRPARKIVATGEMTMQAMNEVSVRIRVSEVHTPTGRPLRLDFHATSAGRNTWVRAFFSPSRIEAVHNTGGQRRTRTIRIPRGVVLGADPTAIGNLGDFEPKIGEKVTLHHFEPMSLSLQKMEVEVLRREALQVGEETRDAYVVRLRSPSFGTLDAWITPSGDFLKAISPLGLAILRDDLVEPETAYTPPPDLLNATAVKTEGVVRQPRQARTLQVRIRGVNDRAAVLSDARQRADVEGEGDTLTVVYRIEAVDPPVRGAPLVTRREGNPALADGAYLNLTDPEIRQRAARIVGRETDRAAAARKIRAWVYAHMRKPTNIGVPRSATEIMRSREGVCRDYAILFAALARAAGIPTRLCSGIVYGDGKFYYHAWVECQIGPEADSWVPYDPTLPTDFVDATHIKFAQGGPEEFWAVGGYIGQLTAEILATSP